MHFAAHSILSNLLLTEYTFIFINYLYLQLCKMHLNQDNLGCHRKSVYYQERFSLQFIFSIKQDSYEILQTT